MTRFVYCPLQELCVLLCSVHVYIRRQLGSSLPCSYARPFFSVLSNCNIETNMTQNQVLELETKEPCFSLEAYNSRTRYQTELRNTG